MSAEPWVRTFQSLYFLFRIEFESQDMFREQQEFLLLRFALPCKFTFYLDEAVLTPKSA